MLTTIYLVKNATQEVWVAQYEDDFNLTILEGGEESNIQFKNQQELEKHVEEQIAIQTKNGFRLLDKLIVVDPENPTIEEIEAPMHTRCKIVLGHDDTSFMAARFRKIAIKTYNEKNGVQREKYSLDTMELAVDIADHDSIKELLEWQLEHFDDLLGCEYSYGYLQDNTFVEYEEEEIPTFLNDQIFYREAAKYEDLHPLMLAFLDKIIEHNITQGAVFQNEEVPYGSGLAFCLAMYDIKYLRNYIDYCDSLEESLQYYYGRFGELGNHSLLLAAKHGFDKTKPLAIEFLALHMVQRDNQFLIEELSVLEDELESSLEDEAFLEALFQTVIQRGRNLSEKYEDSRITEWLARDINRSMETLGLDSDQDTVENLISSKDEIPSYKEFLEMINNSDNDDER